MEIINAGVNELMIVKQIVDRTISEMYPAFYSKEGVNFFVHHHNVQNIRYDLTKHQVYLLLKDNRAVGTGTVVGQYISRVFILPQFQKQGYGSLLLDYLEKEVAKMHDIAIIDVSSVAYEFCLKRGYQVTDNIHLSVANQQTLSYQVMAKSLVQ